MRVSFLFSLSRLLWTDEWLDVMNDIIGGLKDKNEFPEWYEGLHKALFRANEFLGTTLIDLHWWFHCFSSLFRWTSGLQRWIREHVDFMGYRWIKCGKSVWLHYWTWQNAHGLYVPCSMLFVRAWSIDFLLLDNLFSEFMKKFFLNETPKHPLNLGLD
jgi:hypothetical protein